MLAQMAATAGSVAVGSTIGHGISHMLFGGSSAAPAEPAAPPVQQQSFQSAPACEAQAKDFTRCLDKADLQSCSYYLEQLKAVCVCPPCCCVCADGISCSARQLPPNSHRFKCRLYTD